MSMTSHAILAHLAGRPIRPTERTTAPPVQPPAPDTAPAALASNRPEASAR
jgi:hypothetical protein